MNAKLIEELGDRLIEIGMAETNCILQSMTFFDPHDTFLKGQACLVIDRRNSTKLGTIKVVLTTRPLNLEKLIKE